MILVGVDVKGELVGNAFRIAQDLVVTCAHLVSTAPSNVTLRLSNGNVLTAEQLPTPWIADNNKIPDELDFAFLRVKGQQNQKKLPPLKPLATVRGRDSKVGIAGYAGSKTIISQDFRLQAFPLPNELRRAIWQGEGNFPPQLGMSGSPVSDKWDHVVGMQVSRDKPELLRPDTPQSLYFVPIDRVVRHLVDLKIAPPIIYPTVVSQYSQLKRLYVDVSDDFDDFGVVLLVGNASTPFAVIQQVHFQPDREIPELESKQPNEILETGDSLRISAPGGSGKTFFAKKLARAACENECVAIVLTLEKLLQDKNLAEIRSLLTSDTDNEALIKYTAEHLGYDCIEDAQKDGLNILVIADGLNEIGPLAADVLRILDQIQKNFQRVRIVVTDRLVHRNESSPPLLPATLAPLSQSTLNKLFPGPTLTKLKDTARLPLVAYLLREFVAKGAFSGERHPIEDYLLHILGKGSQADQQVSKGRVKIAANVAFKWYSAVVSLLATEANLQDWLSNTDLHLEDMQSAGLVINEKGVCRFWHQLVHDFLAAMHFVDSNLDEVTESLPEYFNALTRFRTSSDALKFAVARIHSGDRQERLLYSIYNWDYPSALYCVLDATSAMPASVRKAICAQTLEKVTDCFLNTRERITHHVAAIGEILGIEKEITRGNVWDIVRSWAQEQKTENVIFEAWRRITLADIDLESEWLSSLLSRPQSLIGWAAANRLGMAELSRDTILRLKAAFDALMQHNLASTSTTRWRMVHAFQNTPTCFSWLLDVSFNEAEHRDVRHGALRSALKIIAGTNSATHRQELFQEIRQRLQGYSVAGGTFDERRWIETLHSCALLEEDPTAEPLEWSTEYSALLQAGSSIVKSLGNKDFETQWNDRISYGDTPIPISRFRKILQMHMGNQEDRQSAERLANKRRKDKWGKYSLAIEFATVHASAPA